MHYNKGRFGQSVNLPRDDMSAIQPNPQPSDLTLDEQSFESLLSAAFTIQEHNKRRKDAGQEQTKASLELVSKEQTTKEIVPKEAAQVEPPPTEKVSQDAPAELPVSVCPHCGSPKSDESAHCDHCGLGEFRPGERLQRNWASMWLKSQAQGLWPERPAPPDETVRKIGEVVHRDVPPVLPQSTPPAQTEEATATHPLIFPLVRENEQFAEISEPNRSEELAPVAEDTCEIEVHPLALPAEEEFHDVVAERTEVSESVTPPAPLWQQLAELQVRLRFHRADLYLCAAVFVAMLALLWPASASPKRAALTPWQRALVTLGIAEAPVPVVHLQGDPAVEVWVDPHTALYYCPGAELYGKTTDGRLTSQREAQLDRFEPAGRSVCE